MPEPTTPLCVSVPEAARLLGIGRSTLWTLIARGEVRTIRIAGRRLIRDVDLADFLAQRGDLT